MHTPTASLVASPEQGTTLQEALILADLTSSKSESRRLIEAGGATINFVPERNPNRRIFQSDLLHGEHLILGRGKRGWAIITFTPC